jgi:hypothetical protein
LDGGEVKLTGPLRVHCFPDVSIKSGFERPTPLRLPLVKSIRVKDAKVSIDMVELAFGRIRIDALQMFKPEITLKEVPSLVMGPDQTVRHRSPTCCQARRSACFACATALSTCRRRPAAKRSRGSMPASTQAPAPERCRASALALRDETVGFALDRGAAAVTEDGIRVPVNLTLHLETSPD